MGTLTLNKNNSMVYYSIYNSLGQLIKHDEFNSLSTTINFTDYASGIYNLVLVNSQGERLTKKLIKF